MCGTLHGLSFHLRGTQGEGSASSSERQGSETLRKCGTAQGPTWRHCSSPPVGCTAQVHAHTYTCLLTCAHSQKYAPTHVHSCSHLRRLPWLALVSLLGPIGLLHGEMSPDAKMGRGGDTNSTQIPPSGPQRKAQPLEPGIITGPSDLALAFLVWSWAYRCQGLPNWLGLQPPSPFQTTSSCVLCRFLNPTHPPPLAFTISPALHFHRN